MLTTLPFRAALPAAVALLLSAPGAFAATPFKSSSKTIVPGTSIAGVSIGQTLKAKQAWTGEKCSAFGGGKYTKCIWDGKKNGYAEFNTQSGKVINVMIRTDYSGPSVPALIGPLVKIKTKSGLGLGSKPDAVSSGLPGGQLVNDSDGPFRYTVKKGKNSTEFLYVGGVAQTVTIAKPF